MQLEDLFRKLSYGELSNLKLGGEGSGTIPPEHHNKVIEAVNTALKDISTRCSLLTKDLVVQSLEWKNLYPLKKEFALSDPTEGLKYIIDSPYQPFTGDIVKILGVANEIGNALPMNDGNQWASVFTPAYDTLQLNHVGYDQAFFVTYQALHPELAYAVEGNNEHLNQEIQVPPVLEDLLRARVALAIFSPMGGQDGNNRAEALTAFCEGRFAELKLDNSVGDSGVDTNVKLMLRGFP